MHDVDREIQWQETFANSVGKGSPSTLHLINVMDMCAWNGIFATSPCRLDCLPIQYHWTDQSCETWIGVRGNGMIKIIHKADIRDQSTAITNSVAWNNDNWFKVSWENYAFPKA